MYSNALLPLVRENDLVMGFSGSGNSKKHNQCIQSCKR